MKNPGGLFGTVVCFALMVTASAAGSVRFIKAAVRVEEGQYRIIKEVFDDKRDTGERGIAPRRDRSFGCCSALSAVFSGKYPDGLQNKIDGDPEQDGSKQRTASRVYRSNPDS